MATDARISTGLPGHPKTKKLIRKLGQASGWNLVCLFLWAAANRSDGDLSGMSAEDIEIAADWAGPEGEFVGALVAVRFLDGQDGSYTLHDWAEHNPWAAGASRRSQVARENAAKKWGIKPEESPMTNAQKRSARLAEARRKGVHTDDEWEAMKHICGNACVECGATDRELSKDHIIAVSKGGSDAIENIQPMCHRCNAGKGANGEDKRPENWRESLAELLRNACQTPANCGAMHAPSPSPSPSPTPTYSVPKGTGAEAPAEFDPDPIFGDGLAYLVRCNVPEKGARSFLGKMRKELKDDLVAVELLVKAQQEEVSDPIPWLRAAAKRRIATGRTSSGVAL